MGMLGYAIVGCIILILVGIERPEPLMHLLKAFEVIAL